MEEDLAICFANLKGTKDKDLLSTARALERIKSRPEYASNAKVGELVGVSGEIVREFLALLRLPANIQKLLDERQLSLDQGRRLWQLSRRRPELLQETAGAMVDMSVVDARNLVDYILRHPEATISEAKEVVLQSKTIKERHFHVVAMLHESSYRALEKRARKRHTSVNELVTDVVQHWLDSDDANE